MSNTVSMNPGEGLRLDLAWKDAAGAALNLTGKTAKLSEAFPTTLIAAAVFTTISDALGTKRLEIPAAVCKTLPLGRLSWVRIELVSADGYGDTTPQLWIDVQ